MSSNMLTVEQVKSRLGLSERTIRRYIARGALKTERVGPVDKRTGKRRNVRVSELELEMFIRTGGTFAQAS